MCWVSKGGRAHIPHISREELNTHHSRHYSWKEKHVEHGDLLGTQTVKNTVQNQLFKARLFYKKHLKRDFWILTSYQNKFYHQGNVKICLLHSNRSYIIESVQRQYIWYIAFLHKDNYYASPTLLPNMWNMNTVLLKTSIFSASQQYGQSYYVFK